MSSEILQAHESGAPVRVQIAVEGDSAVVWLVGEQDRTTVSLIRAALVEAADLAPDVVVDLSEASFMDASTVGALVFGRSLLEARSGRFKVRSPQRHGTKLLEICDLTGLVEPDGSRRTVSTALGSWVEVPVTDRREQTMDGTPPQRTAHSKCASVRERQGGT